MALGDVLVEGLSDADEKAAEAMVLVAAIDDLEAPHVDLLWMLELHPEPPEELRRQPDANSKGWEVSEIKEVEPPVPVVEALVATLQSHGLISDLGGITYPGAIGPAIYRITDLGRRCLQLLGYEPAS